MAGALVEAAAEFVESGTTIETILEVQERSGLIPWSPGGRADPWNHVEAVMALASAGEFAAASHGLEWLARTQRADGSWHAAYACDGDVEEPRIDTNCVAYVATGVLHYLLAGGDPNFAEEMFAVVNGALGFVVSLSGRAGEIPWSVDPDGCPARFSLLAASSSIYQSLRSGVRLAAALGFERPAWEDVAACVGRLVAERESFFADNSQFAMDWYYPALAGVLGLEAARARLGARFDDFVPPGRGVLCRSDRRWVTAAESAECAMALARVGLVDEAAALLETTDDLRCADGSYLTGLVYPERSEFPPGERTTYSAAAVVLAADVLAGGVTAAVFDRLGSKPPCPQPQGSAVRRRTRRLPHPAATSSVKRPEASASR